MRGIRILREAEDAQNIEKVLLLGKFKKKKDMVRNKEVGDKWMLGRGIVPAQSTTSSNSSSNSKSLKN